MQKPLDSIKFNTTILKILILYLSTSAIFLGIIFSVMYEKGVHSLRLKQMLQMRNDYINIATQLYENKDIKSAINNIKNEVQSHFVIAKDNEVLFSNLSIPAQKVLESTTHRNDGFFHIDDWIFIDFNQNRSIERALIRHPFNLNKRPKAVFRRLDSLGLKVVLEGDALNGFEPPKLQNQESLFLKDSTIRDELFSLRIEIVAYLVLSLVIVGVIAYFLVRLSLKPIHEKFNTLERFIKDSMHEINTPLSVILLSIQKIDLKSLTESNLKKLNHIKLAAQNLNHIYQNLIFLNFYKQSATLQNIDLKTLLSQRIEYFTPLLNQKSIKLTSDLKDCTIQANTDEISILLDNLLSNAIKYNKKNGAITITLDDKTLSIQDSGQGMDSKVISEIFERYSRFNENQGGFGIGLSLVKEICNRYNIKIDCQSEQDKGTIFTLDFN